MKLEQQVVSLELAQKLKSLGVKQDCIFFWWVNPSGKSQLTHANEFGALHKAVFDGEYAAFTVAELGEMLPSSVMVDEFTLHLTIEKDLSWWIVKYGKLGSIWYEERSTNEADARAKMLVYLLENKLITL